MTRTAPLDVTTKYIGEPETVTKRELNQQTAQVLERVTSGHPIVITEHGKPRWTVLAYEKDLELTGLARLAALGLATPPKTTKITRPRPDQLGKKKYTSEELDALIAEIKGDH